MDDLTRAKVIEFYQLGRPIQDIARVYRLSVPEVLEAVGEKSAANVDIQGDLIDQSEIGPESFYNPGRQVSVPYTSD